MSETPKITNLTEMSLNKAILTMAVPAAGIMVLESLYNFVDAYWIGKLGAVPLAAVSASAFLLWMIFSWGDLSNVAGGALTSRAVGAKQQDKIQEYVRQCIVVSLTTALVLMPILFLIMDKVFVSLGLEPEVVEQAGMYFTPWVIALPLVYIDMLVFSVFRGVGDSKTPLYLHIVLVVMNAILDPLFIFGFGPIPAMGLRGAAWVTVANHMVFLVLGYMILKKRHIWPEWTGLEFFRVTFAQLKQILRMGFPIALNGALFSLTYVGLTWVIANFGSVAVAAIGMGHRMESFPWFMAYGFSIAASSIVGQFLGAGKPKVAEWAVWKTAMIASLFIALFVLVIFLWVEPVVRFFIDDPAVIAESARYLKIAAVCWLIGLFEVICEGGFSGAGQTFPAMAIGVPLTVARIPAAYIMAITMEMGVVGVWYAIGGSMVLKGLLLALWFKKGGWKTSKVT